jgi:hypothetical protein
LPRLRPRLHSRAVEQVRSGPGHPSAISDENDDAIVDPDIDKRVGLIYPEVILGEAKWLWFLQTGPAPPPNSGMTDSLGRRSKQRSSGAIREVRGRTR